MSAWPNSIRLPERGKSNWPLCEDASIVLLHACIVGQENGMLQPLFLLAAGSVPPFVEQAKILFRPLPALDKIEV